MLLATCHKLFSSGCLQKVLAESREPQCSTPSSRMTIGRIKVKEEARCKREKTNAQLHYDLKEEDIERGSD